MADQIEVKAQAKTVSNEKSKKQEEELAKAKAKKAEADVKAEEEKQQRIKAEEEKKALAEKKKREKEEAASQAQALAEEEKKKAEEKKEELIAGAAMLATAALKTKKAGGFFKGLILGFILGAVVMGILTFNLRNTITAPIQQAKEEVDEVLDETFLGYTAADFKDAILNEAVEHQELIVMEQPLDIPTTLTKSGLGGFAVFSKVKNISYAGTGVFTVDLKHIDAEHIAVDEEKQAVTVTIPHAVLQYTIVDYDRIAFEDTDKGMLAFGDISLTAEQQNELEKSVKSAMEERLLQKDVMEHADEFAVMKTWEVFQPLVTAVSPEYKVEIVFGE